MYPSIDLKKFDTLTSSKRPYRLNLSVTNIWKGFVQM